MPQNSKREQIIDAATALFHAEGFNATGIDKVKDVAQVSKKTLYNHFCSKDELILAVLRREDENIRNWLIRGLNKISSNPTDKLIGIFDLYAEWIHAEKFNGCLFIKAASEFSDPQNKCKIACQEAKRLVKMTIEDLAKNTDADDPETLSAQLNLILQGSIVQAQVSGEHSAIELGKQMAIKLVKNSSSPPTSSQ